MSNRCAIDGIYGGWFLGVSLLDQVVDASDNIGINICRPLQEEMALDKVTTIREWHDHLLHSSK